VRWNVNEIGSESCTMTGYVQAFVSPTSAVRDFVSRSVNYQETFSY